MNRDQQTVSQQTTLQIFTLKSGRGSEASVVLRGQLMNYVKTERLQTPFSLHIFMLYLFVIISLCCCFFCSWGVFQLIMEMLLWD